MATSTKAAAVGYQLYVAASGHIARDELNAALTRQGLPGVSTRMVSHYRSLWASGLSEYVSINEFDLKRRGQRRHIETIFVSATPGYDLRPLVDGLSRAGLKVSTSNETLTAASVASAFRQRIGRADACVAVVSSQAFDSVLFELGVALGLDKPVLLAIERHLSDILKDFQWLPRVVIDSGQLDPLLEAVERLRLRPRPTKVSRTRSKKSSVDLTRFRSGASELSGIEFERLVADLISECGGEVHGRSPSDTGFDFAVWAPRLEPIVPNPLLVEVKLALTAAGSATVRQVAAYLEQTGGTGVALLVYRDGPSSEELAPGAFPVLPIRFDELLRELQDHPFHGVVQRRRNLAVHFFAS